MRWDKVEHGVRRRVRDQNLGLAPIGEQLVDGVGDLFRRQPDLLRMLQQVFQIVPALVMLLFLIMPTMPHLPVAFVGITRKRGYCDSQRGSPDPQ